MILIIYYKYSFKYVFLLFSMYEKTKTKLGIITFILISRYIENSY